jgi:hypothetical protein
VIVIKLTSSEEKLSMLKRRKTGGVTMMRIRCIYVCACRPSGASCALFVFGRRQRGIVDFCVDRFQFTQQPFMDQVLNLTMPRCSPI